MTKSKKLTATVAASAVASALVAPAAFAGTNFSDIDGSFAKDAIVKLADAGILNGVGGGQFNPTGTIERQDFAIILAKALKLDTSSAPATATFSDIPKDHYAFAAVEAAVKAGLIKGTGNGQFGAGSNLTREDMAVIFSRTLDASLVTGKGASLNFSDSAQIADYAKDAVGAAFELGYISGSNGAFDPKGTATREQVASMTVRWQAALEKVANNVFASATYTDANTLTLNFSKEVEDVKAADVTVASKADGKAVAVSAVTLSADKKSATVKTDALAGATTYSVTFGGKTVEVTTPDKLDAAVAAAGAKKVSVTFNSAVDTTKATFSVKKGSITVNVADVAWDDAKKVATLTLSSNLTAGDYTVAANGLANAVSKTFTAEDQKVAKIEINDNAVLTGVDADANTKVTVAYAVYNQYNEDVTKTLGTNVKFTIGNGKGDAETDTDGSYTITSVSGVGYKVGDKISVAAIDPASNTFVPKSVTVAEKASVSEVAITDLFNVDKKTLSASTDLSADEFDLVVSAKDQYGNAVAAANIAKDVLVTVSDSSIVATDAAFKDITLADGTAAVGLKLKNSDTVNGHPRSGTAKVTIVSRTTGKLASYDVNVKESVAVDSITLNAPDLAVAGETVTIPYTAVDQFGNETTDYSVLTAAGSGVNFTATNGATVKFVPNYVTGKAELKLTIAPDANAGRVVVTAVTAKAKSAYVNVAYQKNAVPTVISGLKNVATNFAVNGTSTIDKAHIVILDQYGRDMTSKVTFGTLPGQYQLGVASSDATKVSGAGVIDGTTTAVSLKGLAKGSSTYTLTLKDNTGADIANSAYTFTAKTVDKADIKSYELADFSKLYTDNESANTPEFTPAGYEQAVTVKGVLDNGAKVAIPASDLKVTINTTGVTEAAGVISATGAIASLDATTKEITVPVIVTVVGATNSTTLVKNLLVSTVAPNPVTLTLVQNNVTGYNTIGSYEGEGVVSASVDDLTDDTALKALLSDVYEVVDQYGVDMAPTWTTVVASNFSNSSRQALNLILPGDTFNLTGVTSNGQIVNVKVVATASAL